ncbi:MAG: RHS repeat domain-containing protein, partial [Putridiphycobacter sp.]
TNQLNHVLDPLGSVLGDDLDNQGLDNYEYDEIGQLISDNQEEIESIEWKVTGKVQKITKSSGEEIEFTYDAMGNRIAKKVTPSSGQDIVKTYYVRDVQGNVMSVYTYKPNDVNVNNANTLYLTERSIYGSSRLGIENINQIIASNNATYISINSENPTNNHYNQQIGDKYYELSNHLGNVLEVITDRKLAIDDGNGGVDYYTADVIHQRNYFPFGMVTNSDNSGTNYRYGFQGQELDNEIKGEGNSLNYKYRMHDPRVGRFFAVDPLTPKYPMLTPYQFSSNNPIGMFEIEGLEGKWVVDGLADAFEAVGLPRSAGFVRSYGHSLVMIDPIYDIFEDVEMVDYAIQSGDWTEVLKSLDPTGLSSLPDLMDLIERAQNGDAEAQGQLLGMLPALYGGYKTMKSIKTTKKKTSADVKVDQNKNTNTTQNNSGNTNGNKKDLATKSNVNNVKNKIPNNKAVEKHIFNENKPQKYADTPQNRAMIEDVANGNNDFVKEKIINGKLVETTAYKMNKDGTQTYVYYDTKGRIKGAGYNTGNDIVTKP